MNREEITCVLKKIFLQYFDIVEEFREENFDKALTGHFFFSYLDLVYLYILIEQEFDINIDSRKLKRYRFNTINGIIKIIMESVLM